MGAEFTQSNQHGIPKRFRPQPSGARGKDPSKAVNPDEAVAMGAAIQARDATRVDWTAGHGCSQI